MFFEETHSAEGTNGDATTGGAVGERGLKRQRDPEEMLIEEIDDAEAEREVVKERKAEKKRERAALADMAAAREGEPPAKKKPKPQQKKAAGDQWANLDAVLTFGSQPLLGAGLSSAAGQRNQAKAPPTVSWPSLCWIEIELCPIQNAPRGEKERARERVSGILPKVPATGPSGTKVGPKPPNSRGDWSMLGALGFPSNARSGPKMGPKCPKSRLQPGEEAAPSCHAGGVKPPPPGKPARQGPKMEGSLPPPMPGLVSGNSQQGGTSVSGRGAWLEDALLPPPEGWDDLSLSIYLTRFKAQLAATVPGWNGDDNTLAELAAECFCNLTPQARANGCQPGEGGGEGNGDEAPKKTQKRSRPLSSGKGAKPAGPRTEKSHKKPGIAASPAATVLAGSPVRISPSGKRVVELD